MKTIPLILLWPLILCFVRSDHLSEYRNATIGFLSEVEGKAFVMNQDCLGGHVRVEIHEIADAIKQRNISGVIMLVRDLITEQKEKCPVADLKKIHEDMVKAIMSGEIIENIKQNLPDLINLIKETRANPPKNSFEVGKLEGKIVNIVVYNKVNSISFLRYLRGRHGKGRGRGKGRRHYVRHHRRPFRKFSETPVKNFTEGVILGASDVPAEKNQCIVKSEANAQKVKSDITKIITDLKNMDFYSLITDVNSLVMDIGANDSESVCHFIELAGKFADTAEVVRAALIIAKNFEQFKELVKASLVAIKNGDLKTAGNGVGQILKLAFNYHTQ